MPSSSTSSKGSTDASRGSGWRFHVVLALVLLLGVALIVFQVDLAVPDGWQLAPVPGLHPYPLTALLPALACLLVFGAAAGWLARVDGEPSPRRTAGAVALLWLLAFSLMITLDWGRGPQAWTRNAVGATWSDISNGYFAEALEVDDVGAFVDDYLQLQRANPMKLGTHPPGATLVYVALLRLYHALPPLQAGTEALLAVLGGDEIDLYADVLRFPNARRLPSAELAPALFALLGVAFLGAGTVVPTYLLGARIGDRRTGLLAAALLALMPNTLFYYLSVDVLLMGLSAWALAGLAAALSGPRPRLAAAFGAGVALGAGLLISLGMAAPTALAIGFGLACWLTGCSTTPAALRVIAVTLAGALLLPLAATALGLETAAVLRHSYEAHQAGPGGIGHRAYAPWVFYNVVDYVLLAGLPVAYVALEAVLQRDLNRPAWALGASFVVVMLLLSLSGTVRGETERIWIFFNPALAASAAAAAQARAERFWPLACQPLQLLLMALALPPLVRPY